MARKRKLKEMKGFDEWLREQYCDQHKTMRVIADELHCTPAAVLGQLRRCGIETRRKGYETASQKVIAHATALGKSRKGVKMSAEMKRKLSEAKKIHRIGHKKIRGDGYVAMYYPDYPSCNKDGYVMEHVYIMEQHIGRRLQGKECVHHINRIRTDNRIENLALMTRSEHASFHMKERQREKQHES